MTKTHVLTSPPLVAILAWGLASACLPDVRPEGRVEQNLQDDAPPSGEAKPPADLVPVPAAVACGDDKEVTPDPGLIPGGTWGPTHHTGTSTQAALRRAVTGLLANMYNKCTRVCAGGRAATNRECRSKVDLVGNPTLSENPADWGATDDEYEVEQLQSGETKIKITIRKFPKGADGKTAFNAKQSCKAC